jgi:hypothetical protein
MTYPRTCLGLLFAASAASCGLIDSNVADFDLTLPDKSFSIDASSWQVDQTQADVLLGTSCGSAPAICGTVAQNVCDTSCSATCNASQKCELQLDVSLYKTIDLVTEKPELKSINDQPVIKVTLDSVNYKIAANTLNVATPELAVKVAPMSVMDPKSAEAELIGTVPAVPAGTTVDSMPIVFTPTGKAKLVSMMSTYKTPFNVIVGSTLTVAQGQRVPQGKLDAVISIRAHAGL